MLQEVMYPAIINSPQTELAGAINDTVDTFDVLDGSALPDAPNLATIGIDESAETILYTSKVGNTLSGVSRGFQGVAKSWGSGVKVARMFTEYDYSALQGNITDHETRLTTSEGEIVDLETTVATHLAETVTGWYNIVTGYGADPTGVTACHTEIQAAIDAANAAGGGIVFAPTGIYKITSGLVVSAGVQLLGQGYTTSVAEQGATTFVKDGNFTGITISGNYAGVDNITVDGATGNLGVGIVLNGGRSYVRNTTVMSQGGNGLNIGDEISSRLNLWRAENILALANGNDGVYVHSISDGGFPDANAGYFIGLDARGNIGDGLHVGNASSNTFIGIACQTNTLRGIRMSSGCQANYFLQPYTESNLEDVTAEILIEAGATQNTIEGYRGGISDAIEDNGTGNYIRGISQQITGNIPLVRTKIAFKDLIFEDGDTAGHYRAKQNSGDVNWEFSYEGSGTSPVRAIFKHANAGRMIIQVPELDIGTLSPTVPITGIPHKEIALDFPSIPAHSTAEINITVTGASLRDTVLAVPESLEAGLVWNAYVSVADNVKLRLANVTAGAIDPASKVWTFDVINR